MRILRAGLLGVMLLAAACEDDKSDDFGGVLDLTPVQDGAYASDVPVRIGYSGGKRVEYYDFGASATTESATQGTLALAHPMYWFYDKETDQPLFALRREPDMSLSRDAAGLAFLDEGEAAQDCFTQNPPLGTVCRTPVSQHPIVETIPGRDDYTGFWEIVKVKVPKGYAKDTIKSLETLEKAGYERQPLGVVIHCAGIDLTSTLRPGITARDRVYARIVFWFRRQLGSCILVEGADQPGVNLVPAGTRVGPAVPSVTEMMGLKTSRGVLSQKTFFPTYALETMTGMVSGAVPQSAIFEALPGEAAYRGLMAVQQVSVPTSYTPGTYKAVADIPMDAMMMPDPDVPFRNVSVRGEIPSCMNDMPCTPVGLRCDTMAGQCAAPCDAAADCEPFGTMCDMARHVCTAG